MRDCHGYDGFDVPLNISSSSSAYFSIRREACSIRRVAVERKSLSSARNSSDLGLVCAIAVVMPQATAKMKFNTRQQRASQSEISRAPDAVNPVRLQTRYTMST